MFALTDTFPPTAPLIPTARVLRYIIAVHGFTPTGPFWCDVHAVGADGVLGPIRFSGRPVHSTRAKAKAEAEWWIEGREAA